jgi:uncharacterized spore protein YtfJ
MSSNVMEVIKGIVGELRQIASAESVVGKPVTVGDKTVVPIVKVSVGFGAGGGEGGKGHVVEGFGAGGGGGCIVEPIGFIFMDKSGVTLLPVKPGKIDTLVEAIPGVVEKIVGLRNRYRKSTESGSEGSSKSDSGE